MHVALFIEALGSEDEPFEKVMPLFLIILPIKNYENEQNNLFKKLYHNLYLNQQVFVTSYDIYNTLLNFIFIDKEERKKLENKMGHSLFEYEKKYDKINCEMFPLIKNRGKSFRCVCI